MKRSLKKNYKLILGVIIGILISGVGVYATTTISSSDITYDNSKSGLISTNMKGAIDELYEKSDIRKQGNFVSAYTYSTATSTECITGEEPTCKKSTCYKSKTSGSCKAGDIIKYKVNDTDIVTFHVMYDNGSTLTMQSQKNIINNTEWIKKGDYIEAGGTETDYGTYGDSNKGPLTVLTALENATGGWNNVKDQTYTMGTTVFKINAYTGCDNTSCTTNTYTLSERTAKARMITYQEVADFGCDIDSNRLNSCPKWVYNYVSGTANYWLSSDYIPASGQAAYSVASSGRLEPLWLLSPCGARAVIVVNK